MGEIFELKNMEIKSFRGIKNYTLDFDKKSLVLVGQNGSGKSSIVNAFEFLFTGKIDSLSGKQAIDHDKSIVHLGDSPEDVSVKAKIGDKYISRTLTDGLKCDDDLEDIIDDFKNGSFLLNRKKLLTYIETTPTVRYNNIASLIGFDYLDKIEKAFKKTQTKFNKKIKEKNEEIEKNIIEITGILDCEENNIFDKINGILSRNNIHEISKNTDLKAFLKEFSKKDFERNNKLKNIIQMLDVNISKINEDYLKLLNEYEDVALCELKSTSNLIEILNKSGQIIADENPEKCPVCQNEIESDEVIEYINLKKNELKEKNNTLLKWKNDYKALKEELNKLNYELTNIKSKLDEFSEYDFEFDLNPLLTDLDNLARFNIKLSQMDENYLNNLNIEFETLKNALTEEFNELNDDLNQNDLNNVYEVIFKLTQQEENKKELEVLEKQHKTSKLTHELLKTKKQNALENIISEIEELVSKYYNFIHNHEDFNTPKINVPKNNRLSLDLNFNKETADPRTYSSEGHLDSLGLCIFLAFAKKFNKYDFIILDDIISTVDLSHKERIADLLFTEFKDYKLIITTHNKLWFEQLRRITIKHGIKSKFNFVEIISWKLETGPRLSITKTSKEKIENYLDEGDIYAAGNSIRRYLEQVYIEVCKANEIRVPLKEHPTLEEYNSSVRAHFKKVFNKDPDVKNQFNTIMDELGGNAYIGNLTSHKNEINYDLTVPELEKFRDTVYEFEKFMTCSEHGNYLKFDNNKRIAICTSKSCSYVFDFSGK